MGISEFRHNHNASFVNSRRKWRKMRASNLSSTLYPLVVQPLQPWVQADLVSFLTKKRWAKFQKGTVPIRKRREKVVWEKTKNEWESWSGVSRSPGFALSPPIPPLILTLINYDSLPRAQGHMGPRTLIFWGNVTFSPAKFHPYVPTRGGVGYGKLPSGFQCHLKGI